MTLQDLTTGDRFRFAVVESWEDPATVWVVVDEAPGGPAVRVMKAAEIDLPFAAVNTVRGDEAVEKVG